MRTIAKLGLALGAGAVIGAFISGVRFRHFRDYVGVRLDELLSKVQSYGQSLEDEAGTDRDTG